MPGRINAQLLSVASMAVFLAAIALSVPVLERLNGASWRWYKFAGYSNDGHISLSLKTGLIFTAISVATFGVALMLNRIAKRQSSRLPQVWSFWAMSMIIALLLVYWLLGLSFLNVWRA